MSLLWIQALRQNTESIQHILRNYQPAGGKSWQDVHAETDWHHPIQQAFVNDIKRNGVSEPFAIHGGIVKDHKRLLAAFHAGVKHVPVMNHDPDPDSWVYASLNKTGMPWWNNEREHEYEGDDEYPLRDPEESLKERGQRYAAQVAKAHGVPHEHAVKAIKRVLEDVPHGHGSSPNYYGFASQDDQRTHYSMPQVRKLMDPKTWEGKPVTDIPIHEVHATQTFLRPKSVAHNLFHPGQKQPWEDEAIGDPDYHPHENLPDDDSEPDYYDPEQEKLHSVPRFVKNKYDEIEVADGHHRVAADILLGKTHSRGVMLHHSELD